MDARRAKDIFLDAIEQPIDQRASFAARACGDDDELRGRVEQMLRRHRDATAALDRPAFALDQNSFPLPSMSASRVSEQIGDRIGRYRLVRLLGEGGFGVVYLAEQTEPVVRNVALKIIKRGMDTEQVIARFEMERQALAKMDHPGIARVLDAGATDSGRPYFVMEYVDGRPITTFCSEEQLPIQSRLELIEQACLAVQHAHQKGIIHRDLKPGNILVTVIDSRPVVKVIDFGVAKAIDVDAQAPAMTLETQIIGTPQYMSPEQATTGGTQIDTRTDVYSLGTVLYELVTGAPPFDPNELRRAGIERLCQIIREETPAKPSTRITTVTDQPRAGESRILRRQVAGEVDWIVMKALEKEPTRRYQSPAELAEDIRLHLSHRAVRAGPPSRFYQFRKFARRHRVGLSAATVIALLLVALTIVSSVLAARARRAEADAKAQAQRALEELARANAIVDFTSEMLNGITPAVARGRDTALLRDLLQRSIANSKTKLAAQPRLSLAVGNIIGKSLDDLGDPGAALKELQPIFDATRGGPLKDDPERLQTGIAIANIHIMQLDADRAAAVLDEVKAELKRANLEDSELAIEAKMVEGGVLMRREEPAKAEVIFRELVDRFAREGRADANAAIRAGNNLASVLRSQNKWAESNELWRKIYETERRIYGDDHPSTLMTMIDIGTSYREQGKLVEAEQWMLDAMIVGRKIFEPGHATLLANMNNLGSLLMFQSKLADAEVVLREAYDSGRAKLALSDSPLDVVALSLSRVYYRQGRAAEALPLSRALHQAIAEKYGPRNRRTISLLSYLFEDFAGAGKADEGLAMVQDLGDFPAETTPDVRQRTEAAIGKLFLAAGDLAEARRRARRARDAAPLVGGRMPLILQELNSALEVGPSSAPATTRALQSTFR